MVLKAEEWPWSSLYRRQRNNNEDQKLLSALPTELPANYLESVNCVLKKDDLKEVQHSIIKGTLFGNDDWMGDMVKKYNLGSTIKGLGKSKLYKY